MIPCKPHPSTRARSANRQIPNTADVLVCNHVFRAAYRGKRFFCKLFCYEIGDAREGDTRLFWAFKRLYWFRYAISALDSIPKWFIMFLVFLVSAIMASCTLEYFHKPEELGELRSLITKGLLIAPLVNMLNSGNMYVLNTYRRSFGREEGTIEPRFQKILETYRFLSSIFMFDEVKKHQKIKEMYLRYSRKVILDSINSRSDSEYHNHLFTIWIGIFILIGYMLLFFTPLTPISLIILYAVYILLILKNIGAARVDMKQRLIERIHVLLREDYEKNNVAGVAFIESVSIG